MLAKREVEWKFRWQLALGAFLTVVEMELARLFEDATQTCGHPFDLLRDSFGHGTSQASIELLRNRSWQSLLEEADDSIDREFRLIIGQTGLLG